MRAEARSWTDEIFQLFVEGRLGALSARDVCRAVDWIAERPSEIARVERTRDAERRSHLVALVRRGCRARGGAGPRL